MPLPLPPPSGNPLTTSVFDSPASPMWVAAVARRVWSLLTTPVLDSPVGECSLGPNYIVNAELANYNTGSSDDGDYDKGRPPPEQNNSRWQGDDDDDDDDDDDNGKTTTTTARRRQRQRQRQDDNDDNDNGKTTTTTTTSK
ncbi:hypothetical protein EDB84DRAFT_1569532 [Lactarius hengduanensis]|nr:hypothetical protein EDB84DRAFT_1569532 [Lactarius hengduanensis]